MTVTPIYTSHDLVQTTVLAALNACAPTNNAHWDVAPTGTVARLGQVDEQSLTANPLTRVYVAQHQDGPGQRDPRLQRIGWQGLVLIRCMSRDAATARAGYAFVIAAMDTLAAPDGYALAARFDRQVPIPLRDRIYTTAGQWEITLRRGP